MSKQKTFSPPSQPQLQLPLINLKGNDYMKVAHRLLWFVTDVKRYSIQSEFTVLTDKAATSRATINIFDDGGVLIRTATSHKTETVGDFKDFAEKAETGAIGRALAALGYGTAQAIADLDEGARIVDAPLEDVAEGIFSNTKSTPRPSLPMSTPTEIPAPASKVSSSFAKPTTKKAAPATVSNVVSMTSAEAEWK